MTRKGIPSWLIAIISVLGGWSLYSKFFIDHEMAITPAIDGDRKEFYGNNSTLLSYYVKTETKTRPLVLIHSINAAANAYETRPLFEHYQAYRSVYALDLPGFGFSDRSNRDYSVELYVSAVSDFLKDIVGEPADVIALSLSSEFSAVVAHQSPELFNSLTMISPTGFTQRSESSQESDSKNGFYSLLMNPLWSQALYDLLVTRLSLKLFLGMNFSGDIDEDLLNYHYLSAHQVGARFAPLKFVSGALFTPNILDTIYRHLKVPTLVLYDTDPNVTFDLLPDVLNKNSNWRARRILNTRGLPHFERLDMTTDALNTFWEDIK